MKKVKLRSLLLGTYITFITSISPLAISYDRCIDTDPNNSRDIITDEEVTVCVREWVPTISQLYTIPPQIVVTRPATTTQTGITSTIQTMTTTTEEIASTTTIQEIQTTVVETESTAADEILEVVFETTTEADVEAEVAEEESADIVEEITSEIVETLTPEPEVVESTLPITDQEFILIANVISHEAGCSWIGEYERACIVAAIMNRVNDSRWPNTVDAVVHQPYQMFNVPYNRVDYSGIGTEVIDNAIYAYFNGTYDCGSINSWYGDGRNNHFYTI